MGGFKDTGVIIRGTHTADLGALANQEAVKIDANALDEDFRLLKSEVYASVIGATAGELVGLLFGICDGELTAAEIAECILSEPVDSNDNASNEKAMRPVWIIGATPDNIVPVVNQAFVNENGGRKMEWKKRWTFSNPEGWDFFVFNNRGFALTTGADIVVQATNYGLWVK